MEEKSISLLDKIKSKYILKKILCLAYEDMKPVLKLVKYNKSLLNKLDINIKENYIYEIKRKIERNQIKVCFFGLNLAIYMFLFIFFFTYIISFYVGGKFNDENLKKGYNVKKKRFVDFMDNYILLIYFAFIIALMIFIIINICCQYFTLKRYTLLKIILITFFIDLIHCIAYIIKFSFTIKLIMENLIQNTSLLDEIWFYYIDEIIIGISSVIIFIWLIFLVLVISNEEEFGIKDDIKKYFVNKLNGIDIYTFELPDRFDNLSDKEKSKIIFEKENLLEYKYKSNSYKLNLILNKINDIRVKINIPLMHLEKNECLPDFIINEKTKMYFYPNENIYKLSPNYYVFKYHKSKFQNDINNNEIKNILSNEVLDTISIIEKDEFEYISIYNKNNPNNNIQRNNNDNNRPRIQMDINTNIDIANTEDKMNDISERITVSERSDKEDNEISSIRNIKINKNAFQEK